MRLDVSDMRLFVSVVEAGSITGGAGRAHLSLAAVSARVKEMEHNVGAMLLERNRRGVNPTEAGRALLHHAYALLRQVDHINEDMLEYGQRLRGYVKISCNSTALVEYLLGPLAEFLTANPSVNATIEEMLSPEIVDAVVEGSTDIGIVTGPLNMKALEAVPFRADRWVAVVSMASPLASRSRVRLAELLAYDFVGLGRGTGVQNRLEDHARDLGRPLRQRVKVRNFEAVGQLVASGLGIGIVPEAVARRLQSRLSLRVLSISDKWARQEVQICMRDRGALPLHVRRLVDCLLAA